MFNVFLLIKTLSMVNLCQGLTIYQTDYESHRGHEQSSKLRIPDNNLMARESENLKTTFDWITNQASKSSSNYAHATPYQNGLISNILSQTNANLNKPSSAYYLENFAPIQPIFYEYFNPIQTTTASMVSEQPVHEVNTESEINQHAPLEAAKSSWQAIQTSPVHINNKIYHINRRASPLVNNDKKYPSNVVRKQRNLKHNLDNNKKNNETNNNNDADDKLIEQNSKEMPQTINVSDKTDDCNVAAAVSLSSIKQPLSSSMTSHEIRYLHDIFLNYPKPHHVNYGHIELSPVLFEKRFETLKAGNRYKGEVLWLDNTGGYTQHYWDLAQGKL